MSPEAKKGMEQEKPERREGQPEPILRAEGLRKHYPMGVHGVMALQGVSLSVASGEFVAVMGPSGSGKSTLLHLLGGLDAPTEGEIRLRDQEVTRLPDKEATLVRRRNIGFVFQFFNLLPTLNAEENIFLPLLIDGEKEEAWRERLDTILHRVGLFPRRLHKPEELSGGEQQRVALARALITQPAILLADEPTGNLDTKTGEEVMTLLRTSARELHQAIIMVTHDPKAAAFSDRVVFLQDGQMQQELRFSEAMTVGARRKAILSVLEGEEEA